MMRLLATTAIVTTLAVAPAMAQAPAEDPQQQQQMQQQQQAQPDAAAQEFQFIQQQEPNHWSSNDLIGQNVLNHQDESLGSVTDVIVDEQGRAAAVVIGVGGFLGIGQKDVGVPFEALEFRTAAAEPGMQPPADPQAQQQQPQAQQQQPQAQQQQPQAQQQDPQAQQQQQQDPQAQQQPMPQDQAAQQRGQVVLYLNATREQLEAAPDFDRTAAEDVARADDPQAEREAEWREGRDQFAAPDVEREGFAQAEVAEISADDLIGSTVYDANDDNIGSVTDVVIEHDELAYIVIDIGGFLGIGTHTVALGLDELTVLHDDGWDDLRVYIEATQEQLEGMPEYQAAN